MTDKNSFWNRCSDFYVRYEYASVLSIILIWQIILLSYSDGRFIETDAYTHAMRLMDFIQSGSWREVLYMHDNCPFGQMLHFTRITDMFLYLTTLPFLPFMELKRAVLFGGFLYNPVIACLSAAALIWTGKAFCSPAIRLTGVLAYFFILPAVPPLFLAGRPDHHVLLNLFLILISGCLTYGAKTQKTAYYKVAGIFAGLAVWTTAEGFLVCLFLFAGMVSAWLIRCQNIRQIRFFSQFLFITTTVCWLVNPPMQGLFHPDNSRLSVFTAVIFGFSFLSFYAEELLNREKRIRSFFGRLSSLSVLAFFCFGCALFLFGEDTFFSSPFPPEIFDIWAKDLSEFQPASRQILYPFLFAVLMALSAFFPAVPHFRKLLLTNGFPLLMFILLALISKRFERPACVYAVFIINHSLQIFCNRFPFLKHRFTVICWIGLNITFLVWSFPYFHLDHIIIEKGSNNDFEKILPYLSEKNGCILTINTLGPSMAWNTGKAVIGSPYYSNVEGIVDNFNIFNSTDFDEVQNLLKKHTVSTLVLPNLKYSFTSATTFPEKLVSGREAFCFVKPVTNIPEEIKEKNLIYHIDFEACEKNDK